ncbi:hypothetical protein HY251_00085, partial [bacterium]|nr:hypothetical protein [bacterium]
MTRHRLAFAATIAALLALVLAPGASGDDPKKPRRSRDELLAQIGGQDREARRKAFLEALEQPAVTEDDWLGLLDRSYTTVDEQEEAKSFAARALFECGTTKSFPRLRKLLDEVPQVVREEKGKKVAVHDYLYWAGYACHKLALRLTGEALDKHLGPLDPKQRAEALLDLWVEGEKSYARFKVEG